MWFYGCRAPGRSRRLPLKERRGSSPRPRRPRSDSTTRPYATAAAGLGVMAYGLVRVEPWPSVFGLTLIIVSQLWQIDRFVAIYEESLRHAAVAGS
ncbi:DUF6653 family protein [Nonomuraea sp. NPDC005730]|uniref:DUF6653 family protein n=1 Tax=Nonomuraea sp. NPDC005730 TaxID=3157055 RepID=UPI0033E59B37